ncbi:MAG: PEP-CTERM-box response regulator transcription factor, partial [candidate division Zixibacteria bacterium]|nr:PEP-CTERM-box response regulator transcription factor [candidate division Zixibacteria bacterium]
LIVDDDEGIRSQLKWALNDDYDIILAENADTAVKMAEAEKPDFVSLDITLSDFSHAKEGMDILDPLLATSPYVKIVMVTGNDDIEMATEAIAKGAYDYYIKPIDIDEIKLIINRALRVQKLERNVQIHQHKIREGSEFRDIVGASPKMQEVFELIKAVSPTDETVLITGESGTGKELVARALHFNSNRRKKPFIPINCGAIPEQLLESELFGHEKGSFTGAVGRKIGRFEQANTGTIFLDEIGEMSTNLQVKLLRFLQDHIIERVGGTGFIELDVRIIAATNADLMKGIENKIFREDLFYRISVINIELPKLSDRGEDIILLANYFLEKFCDEHKKALRKFTPQTIQHFQKYTWPGNIRELENKVKKAVIISTGKQITPVDMGFKPDVDEFKPSSLSDFREQNEAAYIREVLARHGGNISKTSRELSISRSTLYDLMEKYKIPRP